MNLPPIKDYQYEAFLGEGATGQVYAGTSGSKRVVAIKLLKRLGVNRKLIAYSLARIRQAPPHPNVVEILDFAMEGKPLYVVTSLHTVAGADGNLAGYSLDAQSTAMDPELSWVIIRQIAEGMAHLHKHGVMHCNLNPRNVMVANPDTPEIKITDFSQGWLAEITHIDFSEGFLHAPPEQLRAPQEMYEGQAFRWDVYAFGVTAFRLLYKHFPRAQRWIDQLREGAVQFHPIAYADMMAREAELTWPPTKGGFDEQRQRVLEKCIAIDPRDRYTDMREVLEHFTKIDREEKLSIERKQADERERVLSEKVETNRRKFSFFRKVAIVLLGGLGVSAFFNVISETRLAGRRRDISELKAKAKTEVATANKAESEARAESGRLRHNLTYSQKTADAFLQFLLNAKNPNAPEYQSITGYLNSARQHYKRVLKTTAGDETLVVERLRAQLGLAMIENQLGEPEEATTKLNALVAEIRTLPEASQAVPDVQETLATALMELGLALQSAGMRSSAVEKLQESVRIYNKAVAADDRNLDLRRKFGKALFYYGRELSRSGQLERALKSQQSAMKVLEALAQSADAREEDEYYLARCQFEVGLIRVWENEGIEAWESFQMASQGYSRLMDQKPQIPEYRFQLARCYHYLGELAFQEMGDVDDSALARNSMRELLGMLLEKDESNRDYQYHLALVQADLSEMARDRGEGEEAVKLLEQSISILTELSKTHAKNADYTYHLALKTALRGDYLLDGKKAVEAVAKMQEALALFQKMNESGLVPGIPEHVYRMRLASFYSSYGHALEAAGEPGEAANYAGQSLEILNELAAKRPKDSRIRDAVEALRGS